MEVAPDEFDGVQDDKQRLTIQFNLRSLMCEVRIIHSQRMQSKFALDFLQKAGAWFMQADPHKRTVLLWLTDKTPALYVSSRFLVRKNKTRLATFCILFL